MKQQVIEWTSIPKIAKHTFFAVFAFLALTLESGCTLNRVSILSQDISNEHVGSSDIKLYPSFNDITEPWQLVGMISAYTLPLTSNTAENRLALVRDQAATLGANAIVGLRQNVGKSIAKPEHSNGLLVKVGESLTPKPNLAKFIVCMPPV
ncbi:MAG: hypothetical protein P8171_23415 [Candidatus Thiodiazotropha sp.]